jgi:hypothetical protein
VTITNPGVYVAAAMGIAIAVVLLGSLIAALLIDRRIHKDQP